MSAMFVKSALALPLFASAALLLFHAINDPMTVLISKVFLYSSFVFLIMLPGIFTLALLAPEPQLILASATPAKLTLIFLLFALAASLHFSIHRFNYP
jgi:hypothetical protein